MGDPKKQKNKFRGPGHRWQRARLESEAIVKKDYGLKNKHEIWKMQTLIRDFKKQAKNLIARADAQARKEEQLLLTKLYNLGLLEKDAKKENILDLDERSIFERRLQTLVHKLGLARNIKQARQMIVHGHIVVKNKKVSVPSYLVKRDEEKNILFASNSTFKDPEHPERKVPVKVEKPKTEIKQEVKELKPKA